MRKLVGVAVSALILALLYSFVDVHGLLRSFATADRFWLASGILFVVPLTLLTSWRLVLLAAGFKLGFLEANRLILAASTLNMFLPSKLGDLAKGQVLARRHGVTSSLAFAIVVMEKALDMLSLLVWGVFGLVVVGLSRPAMLLFLAPIFAGLSLLFLLVLPIGLLPFVLGHFGRWMPPRAAASIGRFATSWQEMLEWFWRDRTRAIAVLLLSVGIWAAHLLQFWIFAKAVGGAIPLLENMAYATLAILVGLLPFTFAGIGTRDAAIVYFYGNYLSPEAAAAVALLATLRYVIPAIAGAPFASDFGSLLERRRIDGPGQGLQERPNGNPGRGNIRGE